MKNIKYRIVARDPKSDLPFRVERKIGFFSLWRNVEKYESVDQAERNIPYLHRRFTNMHREGTVVKQYSSEDLTALMLKLE